MNTNKHELTDAEIAVQWAFKPAAMRAVLVDVLRVALGRSQETGDRSQEGFSALDLEHRGAEAQGGTGIAGSVIRQLLNHGVIAPVGVWVDGQFFPRTIINNGGNPIKLYRLVKPGLAAALLRAHGAAVAEPVQLTLECAGLTAPCPAGGSTPVAVGNRSHKTED